MSRIEEPANHVHGGNGGLRHHGAPGVRDVEVEERIYPGMPHTVVRDELEWLAAAMEGLDAA